MTFPIIYKKKANEALSEGSLSLARGLEQNLVRFILPISGLSITNMKRFLQHEGIEKLFTNMLNMFK
jgi:hypothetical protein